MAKIEFALCLSGKEIAVAAGRVSLAKVHLDDGLVDERQSYYCGFNQKVSVLHKAERQQTEEGGVESIASLQRDLR
ncbi:MAG: hypothetical protein AB8B50_12990 [Pirellulaceae bacterium]